MNKKISGRTRKRSIWATDSQWNSIKEDAEKSNKSIVALIAEYTSQPSEDPAWEIAAAIARMEMRINVLYEFEQLRAKNTGEEETWEACKARAEADFNRQRRYD